MSTPRRIFFAELPPQGGVVELAEGEAQHIQVLRLSVGDHVELFDGAGHVAQGEIESLSGRVTCAVEPRRLAAAAAARVVLAQALLKGPKLDAAMRMVTELGVAEIRLVETQRCVAKYTGSLVSKMQRVRRVVRQAARQSERAYVPEVYEPESLSTLLDRLPPGAGRWIFSARAPRSIPTSVGASDELWVVVGPEGGFTPNEIGLALSRGFLEVGMGPPVLRSETAAALAVGLALDRLRQR